MKATGIVRRIDDLGRIVIPKEIRRVMRIREGDPLELFYEKDSVIFKKYSPIGVMSPIVDSAAEALRRGNLEFAIYDMDCMLGGGSSKRVPSNTPESWLDERRVFIRENKVIYPIIANGEQCGFIATVGQNESDYVKGIVEMIRVAMAGHYW